MANAGAEPPLVCRRGEIIQPKVEGVPIGLLDEREYEEVALEVESGDVLLFFSDGLADQLNPAEQEFGRARLGKSLKMHSGLAPKALVDAVFADVEGFMDSAPITDDQTAIVIRVS
jgi:sigma-B regulation protein RsbU (phosphoserine phosphatase)